MYIDSRNQNLGAKIIAKNESIENLIKNLSLKKVDNEKAAERSSNHW